MAFLSPSLPLSVYCEAAYHSPLISYICVGPASSRLSRLALRLRLPNTPLPLRLTRYSDAWPPRPQYVGFYRSAASIASDEDAAFWSEEAELSLRDREDADADADAPPAALEVELEEAAASPGVVEGRAADVDV